ncbi:MAG: 16S rRNA (guanine(966)-N(2))-methyltransferase RsmD [Zoogloeaceae bacterium]|nr:16S rRNA (guanine(966)-N(2))-methyltransferase RsmD [Zoogloeaceae bacterium]
MARRPHNAATAGGGKGPGSLRIIAGEWRGRRLPIPDRPGLRPTTDRVRETLFNWLQPILPGARCLDLFAGAGGLGFEAASRGAAEVILIEQDRAVAAHLRELAGTLRADGVHIVASDALAWLRDTPPSAFDIVFVDPPFANPLAMPALDLLVERGWLHAAARVYLEQDASNDFVPGVAWTTLREQTAGQARYRLLTPNNAL